MIYSKRWQRNIFISLVLFLRDLFILSCPIRLPKFIRSFLYGNIKFIFIVHPRRKEDVFIAAPFLGLIRRFMSSEMAYKLIEKVPPFVLCRIRTRYGFEGVVIAKLVLPEVMISQRKKALRATVVILSLAAKIADKNSFIGLGGWWPMVTHRGAALQGLARKMGLNLTNGHCGTLCSLFLSIEQIAKVCGKSLQELSLLVVGAGKMGENVIHAFNGKVKQIVVIDKIPKKLSQLIDKYKDSENTTDIIAKLATADSLIDSLQQTHICICTTSNLRRIIRPERIPNNVIIIDDSRPEAFPRVFDSERKIAVLEGGLMKIPGALCDYDFGFGQDDNFFGCLAETFILALDRLNGENLEITTGSVDLDNFTRMLAFCDHFGIKAGDMKSSTMLANIKVISAAILAKNETCVNECP